MWQMNQAEIVTPVSIKIKAKYLLQREQTSEQSPIMEVTQVTFDCL